MVVWYYHHSKNFPQFVVIHTVEGFSIVNEAEVDVFLKFPYFFYDPTDVGSLFSHFSAFSKSQLFVRPPQTTVLTSYIPLLWNGFSHHLLYSVINLHP